MAVPLKTLKERIRLAQHKLADERRLLVSALEDRTDKTAIANCAIALWDAKKALDEAHEAHYVALHGPRKQEVLV